MTTPNKTTPTIEEIKLSDLIVSIELSGRTQKEIDANAKLLCPMLAAYGSWDVSQPGQYFIREGKKHLAAGFTRNAAAKLAGLKTGHFVQIKDDPATLRTSCIRTNLGKPISQFEQGRIYSAMREGDDASKMKVGDIPLAAMTEKEIAESVGYTPVHIATSISIFESSPEIAQLLIEGKVSAGIVVKSRQQVKDEGKQLRYLKAAVKLAESEGKETATAKHLDAVRADHAPIKVAESGKPAKAKKVSAKIEGNDDIEEVDENPTVTHIPQPNEQPSLGSLGVSQPASKSTGHKVTDASIRKALAAWSDECMLSASDDDLDTGVEKIRELLFPI